MLILYGNRIPKYCVTNMSHVVSLVFENLNFEKFDRKMGISHIVYCLSSTVQCLGFSSCLIAVVRYGLPLIQRKKSYFAN